MPSTSGSASSSSSTLSPSDDEGESPLLSLSPKETVALGGMRMPKKSTSGSRPAIVAEAGG